ncbi:MAG: 3'(2'),5'-bisphosphate nucleotidase CysQ [Paracoccaceae bacterium]
MPDRDLDLLTHAARRAGEIAARYFRTEQKVWNKAGGQGPVSEADLEIDAMLRETLLAARPQYGWLSEETADDPARLERERVFIVDPIDGTRAFVRGLETFAHSLAVAQRGRVVSAVVFLPEKGLLYSACAGGGAFLNDRQLAHLGRTEIAGAQVLAAAPQLSPDLWPGGVPPVERHSCPSLAYRLCLVAQGRYDAMITLRDAWEWDIAAGELICREAGVTTSDRFGADLGFNSPDPRTKGVIAASLALHHGFLSLLRG